MDNHPAFKKQCGVASCRDRRIAVAQARLCRNQRGDGSLGTCACKIDGVDRKIRRLTPHPNQRLIPDTLDSSIVDGHLLPRFEGKVGVVGIGAARMSQNIAFAVGAGQGELATGDRFNFET